MGAFFLSTGLVIARNEQFLEFTSQYNDELYFEDPYTGQKVMLREREFWGEFHTQRIKVVDAFSSPKTLLLPDENKENQNEILAHLDVKYQKIAERKFKYIKKLKARGITKGQISKICDALKEIAEEIDGETNPPKASTINLWWRKLDQHNGDVYCLVANQARQRRSKKLNVESEGFLQKYIDENFAINTRPKAASVYRSYKRAVHLENMRHQESGPPLVEVLGERSFYRRIDERSKEELMIARHGRMETRRHFRMIKGHLPADHPLDVAEIDHTPMNLFVIDDFANIPLGRPWLTAIKDRKSGVLLGFYISFQQTGLNAIFGALKHSLSSHHLAYEMWSELENPWPFGRAHCYFSDRGGDFLSQNYRTAIISLGANYEYAQRRTPWVKGSVERFFLTIEQTFFESMPGRTFSNLDLRGDYNPAKDAVVRFSTLVFLLHKWAVDYHNVFPNQRKLSRPIDLWNDGIKVAPPPYEEQGKLNTILGLRHTGKLSHEGIRFKWLNYASDQLRDLMGHFGVGFEVSYIVMPENLGEIYVIDPRTKSTFTVPCTRLDYAWGLSFFQHAYLRKEAKAILDKKMTLDTLVRTKEVITERVADELDRKQNKTKTRLARLAGINSNAVLEGEKRTILQPFGEKKLTAPPSEIIVPTPPPFTNVPTYQWGV